MFKFHRPQFIYTVALIPLLLFFNAHSSAESGLKSTDTLAIINEQNSTVIDFQAYVKMRMKNMKTKELNKDQQQQIFGEYINRELLYQEALSIGLDKYPTIKAEIENQTHNILAGYALQKITSQPIPMTDVQKIYDEQFSRSIKEFKTRHILVKTQAEAEQVIKELDQGKNFAQLAASQSIDASGKNAGELPWTRLEAMIDNFAQAVTKLANGKYTAQPVETQFGWHVIKLDGTRETPPPAIESVKSQIVSMINNQRITNFIDALRSKSNIEIIAGQSQSVATADKSSK